MAFSRSGGTSGSTSDYYTPGPPPPPLEMSVLHVDGNKIKRYDNNDAFLRGVHLSGMPAYPTVLLSGPVGGNYASMYADYNAAFSKIAGFGFNLLRVGIIADWWSGNFRGYADYVDPLNITDHPDVTYAFYQDNIKAYIDAALANSIYVLVTIYNSDWDTASTHLDNPIPSVTFPNSAAYTNWWLGFCAAYAAYPNVLLECYNEPAPGNGTFAENMNAFAAMATAIRAAGYNHLVLVQWGYFCGFKCDPNGGMGVPSWFTSAKTAFAGISNIIYGSHLYDPWWLSPHNVTTIAAWLNDTYDLANAYDDAPLLIGEVGDSLGDASSELFFPVGMDTLNLYGLSWAGFQWFVGTVGFALFTGTMSNPTLNAAGLILQAHL